MGKTTQTPGASGARTHRVVLCALMAALSCAATMVIRVPSPTGGYLNLGDAAVLLGAFLLGPWYGALAGSIGSAMADALSGYPIYVPATLVIKAAMAVTAGLMLRALHGRGTPLAALAGEVPMLVGYWLFDALLLGSFAGSAAGIPGNLVQAAFGASAAVALTAALRKSSYFHGSFSLL